MEKQEIANLSKDLFVPVELHKLESEKLDITPYSYWKSVFKLFIKKPTVILCLFILFTLLVLSFAVPAIKHFEYSYAWNDINRQLAFQSPSLKHLFGLNEFGKDIWVLTWVGARESLKLALVVSAINISLGILIGSIWGYFRAIDPIMVELRNFIYNIPNLLLWMVLLYVLEPSYKTIVLVLCMFGWMGLASFIRNQILVIDNREYNIASKTLGTKPHRMIMHNLLPYLVSVIVTVVSRAIPGVIAAEVSITYFGLGFRIGSIVTLGQVLQSGYTYFINYPHTLIWPALVAGLLTLSFFVLGLNLADATDPKNHR